MNKNTLSIIIPCFDINSNFIFLRKLIHSIDNQKISDFEIIELILINDSPNQAIENLIDISLYKLNISIINNTHNHGQAFSRNLGSKLAKGQYLHFIDQDDLINLDFYSSIKNIDKIAFTSCILFNSEKSITHMRYLKQYFLKRFTRISNLRYFLIFDNIILSPGQMIIRKDIFRNIEGFPELKNYGSDDYGFMYKLSKSNYTYKFYDKAKFYHRLHQYQGKNILNMSNSKLEFFLVYEYKKSCFINLCKSNNFFISIIKKSIYLLFYNRLV